MALFKPFDLVAGELFRPMRTFSNILVMIYAVAGISSPLVATNEFRLSNKCPNTGLYLDEQGLCRPIQPYSETNYKFHGLWKLEQRDIKLDPRQIDLGRLLFFDPILSKDQSMSCATCHDPKKAFSGNRPGLRNSPGLINLAYNPKFFWDGRTESSADQIKEPLTSPLEMANESVESVTNRINNISIYRNLFAEVQQSKNQKSEISWPEIVLAIDSFQKSLVTFTAPYDRYVLGDSAAMTESQVRGLSLFRSFATRCAECHTPPLFTNHQILTVGAPGEARAFKVPTLRQIAKTAPYTHRGSFNSLSDVVKFYNEGGGRSRQGISGRNTHWHVRPIGLSNSEETDLVAFLNALSDDSWRVEIPDKVPSGLLPRVGN